MVQRHRVSPDSSRTRIGPVSAAILHLGYLRRAGAEGTGCYLRALTTPSLLERRWVSAPASAGGHKHNVGGRTHASAGVDVRSGGMPLQKHQTRELVYDRAVRRTNR